MRNLTLLIVTLCFTLNSFAKDVITLQNQQKFEGKIVKLKDCSIVFKVEEKRYEIPSDNIFSIEFENTQNKLYHNYLKQAMVNENLCFQGQMDAQNFHGKKGGHFVLGVLFGPFAILGTALANPSPFNASNSMMMMSSEDKSKYSDPQYLSCYKRKAKGQLIAMEAAGWGAWIIFILMAGA